MEPARFSKTTLYAGEAERDGKIVHVLGYQNTAQHLAGPPAARRAAFGWSDISGQAAGVKPGGNAMILPIPSAASMGPENVLSTKECPAILKDINAAVPRMRSRGSLMGGGSFAGNAKSFSVQVFDTGIYTVVLIAPDATVAEVRQALEQQVPLEKRPPVKDIFIETYLKDWYPGWHLAICCFSNAEAVQADPLLWWYEPLYPNALFLPGLDAHDGNLPDLGAEVAVDHVVAVGSHLMDPQAGPEVRYTDTAIPPAVKALLPVRIMGSEIHEEMPNGDFVILTKDLRRGALQIERLPPPGAGR